MSEDQIPQRNPTTQSWISKWVRVILLIAAFSFTCYLAALSYEGFYTRYLADDYCYANAALHQGVIQGFSFFYLSWSGRFSTILVTQLGTMLGPSLTVILPVVFIFSLAVSLFWFYNHMLQIHAQGLSRIKAAFLTLITAFFVFMMNPVRYQVLDWMNGSITYTLPLIFLTLLTTWFLRTIRYDDHPQNFMTFFGIFLVALVGAGFSETTTALQITVIVLTILFSIIRVRKGKKWKVVRWQLVGLAGSLVGIILMIVAPGNSIRQALLPQPTGLPTVFVLSFQYAWDFLINIFRTMPLPVLVFFVTSLLIGFLTSSNQTEASDVRLSIPRIWRFILIPVLVLILIASICAPSIYAESSYPESRALSSGIYIFVVGFVLLGFQAGNWLSALKSRMSQKITKFIEPIALVILLALSIYPIRATVKLIPEIRDTQAFATAWDQRNTAIIQSISVQTLVLDVPGINSQHGIQELTEDSNNWVNQCVADYYGLESIVAH